LGIFDDVCSRRAGFSEGNSAVPVDLSLKAVFSHRLFDYVHLATQKLRQAPFEIFQPANVIETGFREVFGKPHGHVDVPGVGIEILRGCIHVM
jgi:hypothetical protein